VLAVTAVALGLAGHASAATTPSPTKGVVLVTTDLAYANAKAAGTGIVLTSTGEILTNNHVIRGATTIAIIVPATSRRCTAQVLGYAVVDDVALIKAQNCGTLATATRGDSSKVRLGQFARAVGNANGAGRLVITTGTITGLNRSILVSDDEGGASRLSGLLQTSARLVPGVSGGPLLNSTGSVIGMDTAGSPNFEVQASDGYAIPINRAYGIVKQIRTGQGSSTVHIGKTAFIGITAANGGNGLQVGTVFPGTSAEAVGLQPGSLIVSIEGRTVATINDIRAVLFQKHPGDTITLGILDTSGQPATVPITLGEGPPT
jgi:S1-C subfamily serine protease